jgi:hypothetical protein
MGEMIKDPLVPLSPSLLPQQRLYEVKTLPEWPSGVKPVVGYPGELGVLNLPKRRSRHAIYLCQAEWAWTPAIIASRPTTFRGVAGTGCSG